MIKTKLIAFLSRFFKNRKWDEDDDIFVKGFVNSLFAMQLVMFIEKEFDIVVESEDLDIENFKTVNAIHNLILRKKGAEINSPVITKADSA